MITHITIAVLVSALLTFFAVCLVALLAEFGWMAVLGVTGFSVLVLCVYKLMQVYLP